MRLASGGRVDRRTPLRFRFNGNAYGGYAGDTLASALLANGVGIIARSFKLHRPRGVLTAGMEEPNAIVTVGEGAGRQVNTRATQVPLFDGLVAVSQNCWPSVGFDLGAIMGWFSRQLPAGFHHKTFKWPGWRWYERAVRNTAGLGRLSDEPDADRHGKRFHHCDVLIIGAGFAGLDAALRESATGADVTVLDADTEPGGSLLWDTRAVRDVEPQRWLDDTLTQLRERANVRLLTRTLAFGCYEDNFVTAVEAINDGPGSAVAGGAPRERLWKIRAARVIVATGAIERPLVFANNDLPGVMLSSAVRVYANRYAVVPGRRVAIFTNNDSAYHAAFDLHRLGVSVAAVIDVRPHDTSAVIDKARSLGIAVLTSCAVVRGVGARALRGVDISQLDRRADGFVHRTRRRLKCDLLAMSGGWNPTTHLYSQAGGKLRFDAAFSCFVPDSLDPAVQCEGAANGSWDPGDAESIRAFWRSPGAATGQTVDFLHDVTVADIELAAREGFASIEHMKRYTAVGMAVDQGRTSNVNALAILGECTGRQVAEVGVTTFRPPFHPVAIGALAGARAGELAQRYRRLPITWHEDNGAVLEDHSGWLRAAWYRHDGGSELECIEGEVRAARQAAVLFDSSSLGKIEVLGPDAPEFLDRLYVNHVKSLEPGRLRYGMMLNENGIIMDDGVFARLAQNHYLVCTSSAGARDIHYWMEQWLQCEWHDLDVRIVPQTAQWATITVSGPAARRIVAGLELGLDLAPQAFPHMHIRCIAWEGTHLRVRRASYTGESSYELDIAADRAEELWLRLLQLGGPHGVRPLGMEALDRLRIEKGFLEVGVDTDGETTPLDVGWGAAIAKKPGDFLGRRSLDRQAQQRSDRLQLVGLRPQDPQLCLPVGTHALDEKGRVVGHVTSSCFSPHLNRSIAMGRLRAGVSRIGEVVTVDVDGKLCPALVSDRAFFDPAGERVNA